MPDGRVYVYGSYDARNDMYCSDRYHVVSSANMRDWTVHDVAFRAQDVPWYGDPAQPGDRSSASRAERRAGIRRVGRAKLAARQAFAELRMFARLARARPAPKLLFAPDAAHRDGKYFLYFCMSDGSEGVAVADSPSGPFHSPVRLPVRDIDPAVFIDDDGQGYYYWGQFAASGARLTDDLLGVEPGSIVDRVVSYEDHFFHEGSSMRKIGDTYYFVYASESGGRATRLDYATGSHPLGPFSYRGTIIDNIAADPAAWNNHGSIEKVGDRWYVFYHRSSGGVILNRRLCVEPLTILDDGTIPEVPMTSQGAGNPFAAGEVIPAFRACEVHGRVFIGRGGAGDELLTRIRHGDRAVFRYVDSRAGFTGVSVSASGRGRIEVRIDGDLATTLHVDGDGLHGASFPAVVAGSAELSLTFLRPRGLEVANIRLSEAAMTASTPARAERRATA